MPQKVYPFKVFNIEGSMPRWALTPLAVLVLAGGAFYAYQKIYADPERALLTEKQVNAQLSAVVDEYNLHMMEEPAKHELFEDSDGKLLLRIFKDHCVMIQRQTPRGIRSKLVIDLARGVALQGTSAVPTGLHLVEPLLAAPQNPTCQRGCLNPHPGAFQWKYGNNLPGGWVEVWRWWPEGCTHVQLFHPQSGAWDTNPDGSARVKWTCCTH